MGLMTREEFIAMALVHLAEQGVTVLFQSDTRVDGSSGFYCEEDKELSVATQKSFDQWFLVFIHEYGHFLQGLDPEFRSEHDYPDYYWTRYFEWISHKRKCTKRTIAKYVDAIREVELDCERRVIALIELYALPVDIGEYIQKANAYGYFYTLTKETRKWYSVTAPFDYDEAWQSLPSTFALDYEEVPSQFREVVMARCF